jgi:acyl-CoA thioester hydrolase
MFRHEVRIRYGECDLQGVVFNAHYLAYVDDTIDTWLRQLERPHVELGWDVMVKHADITWHGPARVAEHLQIDASVQRWGTTSFVMGYDGSVDGRRVFSATLTYVGVAAGTTDPAPPPPEVRALLGDTPA